MTAKKRAAVKPHDKKFPEIVLIVEGGKDAIILHGIKEIATFLNHFGAHVMATLQDVVNAQAQVTDKIAALTAVVDAKLEAGGLSTAMQAQVDSLAAGEQANADALQVELDKLSPPTA